MAGVDNKENKDEVLSLIQTTGRELLKQTINVLQTTGSLDISFAEIEELVSKKMKSHKYKFLSVGVYHADTTETQRRIIAYYKRLQVLFYKAYKKYLENSKDFDRLSMKVSNLMEEVLSIEVQEGLKRVKNKIASIYNKFNELPSEYEENSNKIKKELKLTNFIIDELINENQDINEKDKIEKYYNAMVSTGLFLTFALEQASRIEGMVKIFETVCKKYKIRNKIEDNTLILSSYDEVVSRKEEFLYTIKKSIFNNKEALDYLRYDLEINTDKAISNNIITKALESYEQRKEKMYKNYKSLNRIAKDRIERYLNEEAKAWADDFDILDIEQELINDITVLYETEIEVF